EGAAQNHPEDLPRQPQHCDEVRKAGRPRGPARVFVTVTVLPSTKAAMDRLVFKMGKKLSRGRLLALLLPVMENGESKRSSSQTPGRRSAWCSCCAGGTAPAPCPPYTFAFGAGPSRSTSLTPSRQTWTDLVAQGLLLLCSVKQLLKRLLIRWLRYRA